MIVIYGREKCQLCEAAKQKLDLLGVSYEFVSLENTAECFGRRFGGGSTDAMAAYQMTETLPWLWMNGRLLSYPEAMKKLREDGRKSIATGMCST